jgi:hypothetical protein
MVRRAGFEPATSRLSNDVTAIFTTDREWVGGEQTTLLLLQRSTELRHCCRQASNPRPPDRRSGPALLPEVTDVFTTAVPRRHRGASAIEKHAGEQAKSELRQSKRRFGFLSLTGARDAPVAPDGFHGTID